MPQVEVLAKPSRRDPEAAPVRAIRRATAWRASNRRTVEFGRVQAAGVGLSSALIGSRTMGDGSLS